MRTYTTATLLLGLAGTLGLAGCGGDEDPAADGIPVYTVKGSVVDFATGEPLDSQVAITIDGLSPPPAVSTTGANFEVRDIPLHSIFQMLAASPPDYRNTFNAGVEVLDDDLLDLEIAAVSELYLDELQDAFGVTPEAQTGMILGRLVDGDGNPVAGVPAAAFDLDGDIAGPFFLDADRDPDAALTESSASGFFVLYNLPEGLNRVTSKDAEFAMLMPDATTARSSITLADVVVGEDAEGGGDIPGVVSFSNDVAPVFLNRGCEACHSGNGIGKDLGGLHLNGDSEKMFRELTLEVSQRHNTVRVNVDEPEKSLLLTLPSFEDPPDVHPNTTFASTDDRDYQLLLKWIAQGAQRN